ncbi:hypothetical protein BH18ACT4_BH18ACT4_07130 [soil metagenome]
MATSLRDIPGANRQRPSRLRRGRRKSIWGPSRVPGIDLGPRPLGLERRKPPRLYRPRRQVDVGLILLWLFFAVVVMLGVRAGWKATRVDVSAAGITDDMLLTATAAEGLAVELTFVKAEHLERADLTFDGRSVRDEVDVDGRTLRWRPAAVGEGEHELRLAVPRMVLADAVFSWDLVVDGTPPVIDVPPVLDPVPIDDPVTVTGRVDEGSTLTIDGERVPLDDGTFSLPFAIPPAGPLHLEAVDEAGNRTSGEVIVPVAYPGARGVHVTAAAWNYDELRQGVLDLIDAGLIDTVELDLKDESGIVGYDSQVPRALEIGAVRPEYDLADTVELLEARGVRVVGRIVAFRDPVLASAAWAAGQRDHVVQGPDGEPFAAYGGFTNYGHPDVRRYNIDIALEAVEAGVSDILWDYVRRPDGQPETMVIPGLDGPSTEAVAQFLAQSHEELRAQGAYQGASVFGIAASRPDALGQHIPSMARHTDYLSPMVYPSHWVDGEYRVESPIRQPYEITSAALADFQAVADGTGIGMVPWLQDFTLYGVPYGPAEVRAQIDAARAIGIDSFLLWNPGVRYTAEALVGLSG